MTLHNTGVYGNIQMQKILNPVLWQLKHMCMPQKRPGKLLNNILSSNMYCSTTCEISLFWSKFQHLSFRFMSKRGNSCVVLYCTSLEIYLQNLSAGTITWHFPGFSSGSFDLKVCIRHVKFCSQHLPPPLPRSVSSGDEMSVSWWVSRCHFQDVCNDMIQKEAWATQCLIITVHASYFRLYIRVVNWCDRKYLYNRTAYFVS